MVRGKGFRVDYVCKGLNKQWKKIKGFLFVCFLECVWLVRSSSWVNANNANKKVHLKLLRPSMQIWGFPSCVFSVYVCVRHCPLARLEVYFWYIPEAVTHCWHRPCWCVYAHTQTLTNSGYFLLLTNTLPVLPVYLFWSHSRKTASATQTSKAKVKKKKKAYQ